MRDTEGDELADGLDEIICPWDFDWDGRFIKDDDFAAIFVGLKKGVSLEVILDSCHSGTGTREMILDRTSFKNMQPVMLDETALWSSCHCIRPRYLAPPRISRRNHDPVAAAVKSSVGRHDRRR